MNKKYLLNFKSDQNTNDLVYVHILKKLTNYLINFKNDQKHKLLGICSYKKKQLEQNCCQTSRMTKNTNDLVIIYLHLAEIKILNLQLLKKKITK